MDIELYLIEKRIFENKIKEARNCLKNLESRYISSNRKLKDGQKVTIKDQSGERLAFIKEAYILYDGSVGYKFWKCKKDGTASQHEDWMFRQPFITELNLND